jgi:hypothetical protein
MIPRIGLGALAMAVVACAVSACGDQMPTDTTVASSARPNYASADDVVGLLKRTEPLRDNLTATGTIGPRGGHLQIKGAGFRIDFPRGAVLVPTRITVTALRGDNVAYQFEPHGLVFSAPVTIRQELRQTAAWKTPLADELQGSYFERLVVDASETFARSKEKRAGSLKDSKAALEFSIEHFSGYMVSTGEVSVKVEVTIDITGR